MDDIQRSTQPGQSPSVDTTTPLWNKLVAAGVIITLVAAMVVFHHRIGADFWPLDASRIGPNLVASAVTWAIIFTASVLIYPPWRRRLHRFLDGKLSPLHDKLDVHHDNLVSLHEKMDLLHEKHEELAKSHEELHAKLDKVQNGNV